MVFSRSLFALLAHYNFFIGEVHGVTIVNSSARSNMELATASGTQVRTSPSEETSVVQLELSSCANVVKRALSASYPMTAFFTFFT